MSDQSSGRTRALIDVARPFTLVAPALGFLSGAVTAIGASPREPVTSARYRLSDHRIADGGDTERRVQRAEPDLRSRDRSDQQTEAPCPFRTAIDPARRGCSPLRRTRSRFALAWLVAPGGRHECFWIVIVATLITVPLLSAPVPHEALRDLGQRDDRHPAWGSAQGGGLVGREDRSPDRSPGISARSSDCSSSAP